MRPEEEIEKRFVKKCEAIGVKALKFEITGIKGAPDRICFLPKKKVFLVEFKRPGGGVVSHHQYEFIHWLRSLDHVAMICDSWEEPLSIVKEMLSEGE